MQPNNSTAKKARKDSPRKSTKAKATKTATKKAARVDDDAEILIERIAQEHGDVGNNAFNFYYTVNFSPAFLRSKTYETLERAAETLGLPPFTNEGDPVEQFTRLINLFEATGDNFTLNADDAKKDIHAPAEPSAKQLTVKIKRSCDYWKSLGILAGDLVTMTPATALQPRRIVAVYRHAGALEDNYKFDAGRFLRYESDVEFDGIKGKHPAIVIEDIEGCEATFNLDTWTPYSFTTEPRKQAQDSQAAALRARLNNLDDITDSTQRFEIERKLYDLERDAPRAEWPEIIGDEGSDQ